MFPRLKIPGSIFIYAAKSKTTLLSCSRLEVDRDPNINILISVSVTKACKLNVLKIKYVSEYWHESIYSRFAFTILMNINNNFVILEKCSMPLRLLYLKKKKTGLFFLTDVILGIKYRLGGKSRVFMCDSNGVSF